MASHASSTTTPTDEARLALSAALIAAADNMRLNARTPHQRDKALFWLHDIINAGERIRNEAADRHNVYPLYVAKKYADAYMNAGTHMDADRARMFSAGSLIVVAAEAALKALPDRHRVNRDPV